MCTDLATEQATFRPNDFEIGPPIIRIITIRMVSFNFKLNVKNQSSDYQLLAGMHTSAALHIDPTDFDQDLAFKR